MRSATWICLAPALFHGPAIAQNNQVQRGPLPVWVTPSALLPVPAGATGLAFTRRQDVIIHLDKQGQTQHTGYWIKILHSSALKLGNISISWNPAAGSPTVHVVKVHRGEETIDVLKTASFEILRREDQLEAARIDGILTAVLRVPDLRVGDELEVALTTRVSDPTLGNADSGVLFIAPSPAPGGYRLGLNWTDDAQPQIKMTPDMASVAQKGARSVDFRMDNPPLLVPPKDAPQRYQWQRNVEFSVFPDWEDISRRFASTYAKAAKLTENSPLKREAARIAAAGPSPFERASAALKLVQQDVRYIYVGLNGGNLTPAAADETWQRRYGDCKGKTALLLALLAELGVKAEAVLVNASGFDDGLNDRLPSPRMFDHVIVRAQIDGKTYYLDGTLPPVVPPTEQPLLPYKWVLPLTAIGRTIERIDWRPPTSPDEITLYEIDARAGFGVPARITTTTIVRGIKGLQQQVQLSELTPADLLNGLRQQMVGGTWQSVDEATWRYDQKAQASILKIGGTGTVDWDDDGNGAKSMALPGGGFNPPERRVRAADQKQDIPFYTQPEYSCYVTTVRIPSGTTASQWSFKPGFDVRMFGRNYYRAFDLRDGAIRMIRGSRVEQPEIDAETARKDNARIASFDNSMGYIFYDPKGVRTGASHVTAVPATYDIDWTADRVPCLSAAALANAAKP